jgi:hypothetical protein
MATRQVTDLADKQERRLKELEAELEKRQATDPAGADCGGFGDRIGSGFRLDRHPHRKAC